jgi:hypothetical protein
LLTRNLEKDDPPVAGPYEWQERKHIRQFLRRHFATIPTEAVKDPNITLAKLAKQNAKPCIEPPIPKRTITSSIQFKDSDGEPMLVKINGGIEGLFEGKECGDMPTHIYGAVEHLHLRGVEAPAPGNTDKRHPRNIQSLQRVLEQKKAKMQEFSTFPSGGAWRAAVTSGTSTQAHTTTNSPKTLPATVASKSVPVCDTCKIWRQCSRQ